MEPTPLTVIQRDLQAEDYDARLLGIDDENLYERLFVVFDRDDKGRDCILQLMFINDVLNLSGQPDEPEDIFLLQFSLELPFRVPEASLADVARLLLALSRVLRGRCPGSDRTRAHGLFQLRAVQRRPQGRRCRGGQYRRHSGVLYSRFRLADRGG